MITNWRRLLSLLIPVHCWTVYREADGAAGTPYCAIWWQWRGRVFRHTRFVVAFALLMLGVGALSGTRPAHAAAPCSLVNAGLANGASFSVGQWVGVQATAARPGTPESAITFALSGVPGRRRTSSRSPVTAAASRAHSLPFPRPALRRGATACSSARTARPIGRGRSCSRSPRRSV